MSSRDRSDPGGRFSDPSLGSRTSLPGHIPNVRRSGEPTAPTPLSHTRFPKASPKDLADARKVAGYGEPGGWIGAMFYSLHFWFRRRKLIKKLHRARVEHDRATVLRENALEDLGKRLHQKNGQIDLSRLTKYLDPIDQTLLAIETSGGLRGRLTRDGKQKTLTGHYKQLAEAAAKQGAAPQEPQGWGKLQLADRAVKKTQRTAYLTELGIDLYDPVWVRRGAIVFWCTVLFVIAAAVFAVNARP